jgi:L-fuculose-phosphate aldolase
MTDQELREQICLIGQLLHRNRWIDGAGGNISARLDDNRFLATPSGLAKGFMQPDHLIVVDPAGKRVDVPTSANRYLRPTSEIAMHLACYDKRPDVGGVVHAHPPAVVALTAAGIDLSRYLIPEVVITLGVVSSLPYSAPGSPDLRHAIEGAAFQSDALILALHGSLTLGTTVWDAYLRLENLDFAAQVAFMTHQLGGLREPLSSQQIQQLMAIRERIGLLRPGDSEILRRHADNNDV